MEHERETILMALAGFEAQVLQINRSMRVLERLRLSAPEAAEPKPKRHLSRAARKRIAQAQKLRWASWRQRQAEA